MDSERLTRAAMGYMYKKSNQRKCCLVFVSSICNHVEEKSKKVEYRLGASMLLRGKLCIMDGNLSY